MSIVALDDAHDLPLARTGGKGAVLARLRRRGFDVPPGFVLTTEVDQAARAHGGSLPDALRRELLARWRASGWPRLAVRSSGVLEDRPDASLAGQLETVLGAADEASLVAAVERVLASARSPRVRAYLGRRVPEADPEHVLCACLVQPLLEPSCAGVAFGVDPRSGAGDRLLIECVPGRGDALVSGRAQPERHVVSRPDLVPLECTVSEGAQPNLSRERVLEVAKLVVRIEVELGATQDVEWALADGRIQVLQARPVTALPAAAPQAIALREELERLRGRHGREPGLWSNFMAAELLPQPTLASLELIRAMGEPGSGGVVLAYERDLGLGRTRHGIRVDTICGRTYGEARSLEGILADMGLPVYVAPGDEGPSWPRVEWSWVRVRWGRLALELPRLLWRAVRAAKRGRDLMRHGERHFTQTDLPAIEHELKRGRRDLQALDDTELVRMLDVARGWCSGPGRRIWERCNVAVLLSMAVLELRTRRWLGDRDGSLAASLVRGAPGNVTLETNTAIGELTRVAATGGTGSEAFEAALARFLTRYGHRATTELELSDPRWREDPGPVLASVSRLLAVAALDPPAAPFGDALLADLPARRRRTLQRTIETARRNAFLRETPKFHYLRRLEQLRALYRELGRRSIARAGLERADDVFQLARCEIDAALRGGAEGREIAAVAAARRTRRELLLPLPLPPVFRWERLEEILAGAVKTSAPIPAAGLLRGDGVSPGRVSGRARIVTDPSDARELGSDAVLVAPRADPGWTPLFLAVRAVVVETGSVVSHSSIVAREYRLPMVVNVPGATRLREGTPLTVDGSEGWVRVEEPEGPTSTGPREP
jgi:pyruvate,water dikinase